VRSIPTNPYEICSCSVSAFQVSKRPSDDNLQLQYLSKERRFTLVEKGNVLNYLSSPMPKEERGMSFEILKAPLFYSIVDGNLVDELSFRSDLNFDVVTCHPLIDDNTFARNDGKKNNAFGNCDADEFVSKIIIIRHLQDKKTYKPFHRLDLGKNMHSLIFCEKLLCINKNVRMRFETYECLKTCMSLICLFDMTMTCKMVSALKVEDGVSNLLCYPNSAFLSKIDRLKFRLHDHLDEFSMYFDYNSNLIMMHALLSSMEIHFEKVNSSKKF